MTCEARPALKIGDDIRVKTVRSFDGMHGRIRRPMLPDYDWAVEIDGMSMDSDDLYGFDESELETL